ncbi:MAG TPA: hypothetical protein VNP98_17240 [Chthoniobacterales bacterium]|nr:hypothetical protein [Chthoniobacterales bacterium]
MSQHETATPSPKISITPATKPPPPWSGVKFTCDKCQAEYQLEAGDQCIEQLRMEFESRKFATPACWDCEHVNIITLCVHDEPEIEGNPS